MKFFLFSSMLLMTLLSFTLIDEHSCSKENKITEETVRRIEFLREGEESPSGKLYIDVTINYKKEIIVEYNASSPLLEELKMNAEQLHNYLTEQLGSDPTDLNTTARQSQHAKCIQACNDKYTDADGNRIKGRGKCKFSCWVDTVVNIVTTLGPSIIGAFD